MRLLVLSLMLLMLALPPLLGAPPFYLEGVARPSAEQWLDFWRTFAAALAGAGAAFLANRHLQERARRLDEIAAGNYALGVLVRQYNGFLNVRKAIREEVARRDTEAPETPLWFTFRPILHFLREDLEFDFHALTFLFEHGNIDVFEHLHTIEGCHRHLEGCVRQLNEDSREKQNRLEGAGFVVDGQDLSPEEARAAVGPRLEFSIAGLLEGLQAQCSEDEPKYLKAEAALRGALARRFGVDVRLMRLLGSREGFAK